MEPKQKWTVYCHTHVDSDRRYVGLTSKTMMARWNQHVSLAKRSNGRRSHFAAAIRKYGNEAFSHEVVRVFDNLFDANISEKALIRRWRTRDPRFGFNLMRGGQHVPHSFTNPWARPEYRRKSTEAAKRRWEDPEYRRKSTEAAKRRWEDSGFRSSVTISSKATWLKPDVREEQSKRIRAYFLDPRAREKNSASQRGRVLTDEHRAKLRVSSKAVMSDPIVRAKVYSPEANLNRSKASKASWANSEIRERRMAVHKRPEVIARKKQRHTHCGRGHPMDSAYVHWSGKRYCRICRKLRDEKRASLVL